jgi:predicted site-specific integrase-resolvase
MVSRLAQRTVAKSIAETDRSSDRADATFVGGEITMKRAALYVRVSTDRQTVENQIARLTEIATARGWKIIDIFSDAGIGGAKGRKDRPGLDEMLKQAQRHRFDVVMA